MSKPIAVGAVVLVAALFLTGCAQSGTVASNSRADPAKMLVTEHEASANGGWTVTPDSGPVDGDTTDCTGAPYDWPDVKTLSHASQFLDSSDGKNSIAVVVKSLDGAALANIQAVRGATAPCKPSSGEIEHGAMIHPLGDDSFAYQVASEDDTGKFVEDDTLIACGRFEMEAIWISHTQKVDQSALEDLLAGAIKRMLAAGHCFP